MTSRQARVFKLLEQAWRACRGAALPFWIQEQIYQILNRFPE